MTETERDAARETLVYLLNAQRDPKWREALLQYAFTIRVITASEQYRLYDHMYRIPRARIEL